MRAMIRVLFALALVALPGSASATTIIGSGVGLDTLLGGGSVQVGDKLFESFTYNFTGDMPDAAGVNVIPIIDSMGNYGIRFQGAFVDLASTVGGSDALVSFQVTATAPGFVISEAHLAGNPTLLGTSGSISVTETFDFDPNLRIIIFDDESGGTQSTDSAIVPNLETIAVTKDILAIAVGQAGQSTVTMSFIDQTFAQIPEPGTLLLLLGSGLPVLAIFRRRSTS